MNTVSEKLIPYRAFIASEQQRLKDEIASLENESRQDEADFLKIRLNILGVFETVASVDEKLSTDWADFCARYEPRFDTLTAPWRSRLASAVRNSDSYTRRIEEFKLTTAARLRAEFDLFKG